MDLYIRVVITLGLLSAAKTQRRRWRGRRLLRSLGLEGLESLFSLCLDLVQPLLDFLGLVGMVGAGQWLILLFLLRRENVVGGRKIRGGLEGLFEVLGNVYASGLFLRWIVLASVIATVAASFVPAFH